MNNLHLFKTLTLLLAATYLCMGYHSYYQTSYDLILERGSFTYVNPDYLYDAFWRVYRYNRTIKAFDVGYGIKYIANTTVWITVVTARFMSNEYRRFPMDLKIDVCRALDGGSFGFREMFLRHGNVSCPFKPGYYLSVQNLLDSQRHPPGIPAGRYKVTGSIYHNGIHMLTGDGYCEIRYKR